MKQTIEYFSKCGDSVQRRALQDLEAEPTLGSLRCIPRVKQDGSILDLSHWKPSFAEMQKSLVSSHQRFKPAGPGITLSQRLPGISSNCQSGQKKKKKNHKSTLSLLSSHSRSQSITSLQVNNEQLHFFYRPIPTLKRSVLLKLQPSLAYYMDTFNYQVDVLEKCLRQFFLLLQVEKQSEHTQCDLFPKLLRIKVQTKKYFEFLSRSQALALALEIDTVHSFFQNIKSKSIELFKACLAAIDVPILDFQGFMKVRYFFIEKRAKPAEIIEFVTDLLSNLLGRESGFNLLKHQSSREESLDEFTIPNKMVRFLDSVKHDDFFDNEGKLSSVGFRRKCKTGELDALTFLAALY